MGRHHSFPLGCLSVVLMIRSDQVVSRKQPHIVRLLLAYSFTSAYYQKANQMFWPHFRGTLISSIFNHSLRIKLMIMKMNTTMFLLFIRWKGNAWWIRVMKTIWGLCFAPLPPGCHNCVSVSPDVTVLQKGTFIVSVLLCQEVKRI